MPTKISETRITGRHHPLLKRIRAMVRSGELLGPGPAGQEILLETPSLIEEALRCGVPIHAVLYREGSTAAIQELGESLPPETRRYWVQEELFPELTSTETSPGIVALAQAPAWTEQDLFAGPRPFLAVLAGVQDPGNLGTILRTAEALGATGTLAARGTVSPYNAKAFRAAAGTLFRLPVLWNLTAQQIVAKLREHGITLLSSVPRGGRRIDELDLGGSVAVALGAEGSGLPRELEEAGCRVSIPMAGAVESLNVAAAAAILLYEIARQRQRSSAAWKGA
ncbi:MAG TPA: RNA methyltransferase [Terriglobia bacterium]|nr:RNA methyltransferase [Terriglobia bacterium]